MNRRFAVGAALAAAVVLATCRGANDLYFDGDFGSARAEAAARGTLVMVQFTTDWCSWCRRLEADTLASSEVRRELGELEAVELDAEQEGRELARRFDVVSYPTVVFADAAEEMAAGEPLADRPPLELYPGPRETSLKGGTAASPRCDRSRCRSRTSRGRTATCRRAGANLAGAGQARFRCHADREQERDRDRTTI